MVQRVTMQWEGRRLWFGRGQQAASRGLRDALEHTLGKSKEIVPLDEGTLMNSGRVVVDGLDGTIVYDSVYARRQHEELTWRHAPGRSAKYLEIPFRNEREAMLRIMAIPLRALFRS
ncbi:minor capsid protein [Streptomyces sp. NPDC088733]|uniref:minor capsid protein n=1 Tax=Streptomyces sp. NPDC088733 TaxID=3365880 RepID=UPI0038283867